MKNYSKMNILVTGASTGIGAATALFLYHAGFKVIASVRKLADAENLKNQSNNSIQIITMDVSNSHSIKEGVAQIKTLLNGVPLYGLVNNAGVCVAGPLESLTSEQLRYQFDVNVFGLVELTHLLLPDLKQSRGRVVNVGSISGKISFPFIGAYSASKFALEALCDAWRVELTPWGVKVVLIEPGPILTPIFEKSKSQAISYVSDDYSKYLPKIEKFVNQSTKYALPAQEVSKIIFQSLVCKNPSTRYIVGTNAKIQNLVAKFIPYKWMDFFAKKQLGIS